VVCIKQILSVYCIPYRWFLNINCYPINFILFLKSEGQDNAMIVTMFNSPQGGSVV